MRRFTAYIFDLDGVLCHTDKFHFAAWAALAKKLDLPFDASVNDRLRGVSRMASLDIVLGEKKDAFTAEQKTLFAKEKNAIYRGYLQTMTPADLDEDVRSTLLKLRADGHKLAVGSSSKNAPLILERIGLGSFFDAVADGTQITHSKPDPEVFLLAAKLLGVKPDAALVVEDAEAGIQAAKAGGFCAAGIGPAANSLFADFRLQKLSDLLKTLSGTESGLVVYTNEPFLISPLSEDGRVIDNLLRAVTPDIVPENGDRLDRALDYAVKRLRESGRDKGNIVVLAADVGQDFNLAMISAAAEDTLSLTTR